MNLTAPEPQTVTVIDYDLTLACGKEIQFTVRPDLGDAEVRGSRAIDLTLALTKHRVEINLAHVVVVSRREREMKLLPPKLEPKTK